MTKDFVLEIGAENIPASYLPPAIEQLRVDAEALLARTRLAHADLAVTGTPRRLTLMVSALADRQSEGVEVTTGPPTARAFTGEGRPTPAAEGFARAQGVAVDALERIQTERGEYLGLRKALARRAATVVLREELPALVAGLRFPRTMKWEASGARFARPVRWIVALYGRDVVRFRFADVESGRVTHARPWMRRETRSIPDAKDYRACVKELHIVLDAGERRRHLHRLAETAARARRARLVDDPDLLTELAFMVEDPKPLAGEFDPRYLNLPPEVIVVAMKSHQRYLALTDANGRLLPAFVTFTDGPVRGPRDVIRGNQKVLRARLEDAEFYWREDVKRGVDALADELDRMVFVEGMGTLGQKWRRVLEIAREVNARRSEGAAPDDALARAARLMKADLASAMIRDGKEFTALQGVVGAHYARACGESEEVATAIREHYQPRAVGDPLPATALGTALALADRLDTLTGCFLAGIKPSGSQDPFALRRAGNGAVRLACELPGVRLDELLELSASSFASVVSRDELDARWAGTRKIRTEVRDFMRARVETLFKEQGIAPDVVDAVVPVVWMEPAVARARARAIAARRGEAAFERLITGARRVANILPRERRRMATAWPDVVAGLTGDSRAFRPAGFEESVEADLLAAVQTALEKIPAHESRGEFEPVFGVLSRLSGPIDAYFERVLVNAEDPSVRENRLSFLAAVYALFGRYADFLALAEGPRTPAGR